ncbi:glycosyl transferase [Porphyrobacter sp. SLTP]|uniref:glycosyl transferase n=1 Tax=Porphyrobacter sp. SLTP TaxID=2683266 RepID=UPI0014133138|nr:glycosyl transferase [Porphyrobacter sp. SLTP]NBB23593.1 glycosyl transferase [Porphyrobacter sp. SLTP]
MLFKPVGAIKQSIREGGPVEQRRTRAGQIAMRNAAMRLPTLSLPPEGPPAEISFLSGPRFWYQTLFCFYSLQLQTPFKITPIVYDDGGMDVVTKSRLLQVVPWMQFEDAPDTEARLDELLPASHYPTLRARRRTYPHLRKLTDIHIGSNKCRLVADSDMLFFRPPDDVIDWFTDPQLLYMQDVETAYGYPIGYLNELAGANVPEPVNVGLYGLTGANIDWGRVEYWCRRQLDDYGPSYLQEQALTAMLFASEPAKVLSRVDYVVMPDALEGERPRAVLHHYVDVSKQYYFRYGWRQILDLAQKSCGT